MFSALLVSVSLSPAEGRVAQIVLDDPQFVAFGTMAELTTRAEVGAGTVVRLCSKVGLSGFAELQKQVQQELTGALRPAADRIKDEPASDLIGHIGQAEQRNVAQAFARLDRSTTQNTVELLSDLDRHVVVMACDSCRGIGMQFAHELSFLRPNVELLDGNPVTVGRRLALGDPLDVVVAMDVHRYDNWLHDTVEQFVGTGASVIALTDNDRSPLARLSTHHFTIYADSPGPFDSFTSLLGLLNALNAETAISLRGSATQRLEKVEQAWRATKVLDR